MKHLLVPIRNESSNEPQVLCVDCKVAFPEDTEACPYTHGVICNMCAEDMVRGEDVNVYGLQAEFATGPESSPLEDGYEYKFNLCEECLKWLFEQFQARPPKRRAYLATEPGEHKWHDDIQFWSTKH